MTFFSSCWIPVHIPSLKAGKLWFMKIIILHLRFSFALIWPDHVCLQIFIPVKHSQGLRFIYFSVNFKIVVDWQLSKADDAQNFILNDGYHRKVVG